MTKLSCNSWPGCQSQSGNIRYPQSNAPQGGSSSLISQLYMFMQLIGPFLHKYFNIHSAKMYNTLLCKCCSKCCKIVSLLIICTYLIWFFFIIVLSHSVCFFGTRKSLDWHTHTTLSPFILRRFCRQYNEQIITQSPSFNSTDTLMFVSISTCVGTDLYWVVATGERAQEGKKHNHRGFGLTPSNTFGIIRKLWGVISG